MTEKTLKYPSENTRTEILNELLDRDLTALDITDILGINESAVRRHLDKLENRGLIDSYFVKASQGRPKKYFTITEEGKKLFPQETELMLNLLIKSLKDTLDEERLEEISDLVTEGVGEYFPEVHEEEDLERKIEKIVKGSDELGFYSSYSRDNEHYKIKYKNCAFGNLPVKQASWLCNIHRKIVSDLLGDVKIQQEESMLKGDKICVQRISG